MVRSDPICSSWAPSPGMRKTGTRAGSLGTASAVSLLNWVLECEKHGFWFVDFNYSTQMLFFFFFKLSLRAKRGGAAGSPRKMSLFGWDLRQTAVLLFQLI